MYSRQVRRQITRKGTLRSATHYLSALRRQSKYMPHHGKNVHYDRDLAGQIIRQKLKN